MWAAHVLQWNMNNRSTVLNSAVERFYRLIIFHPEAYKRQNVCSVFCDFVAWFISCTYDSRVIRDIVSQEKVLSGCFITVYDIKHADQFNGQLISDLTVNYVITVIICLVLNSTMKSHVSWMLFLKSGIWKLAMYSHCWTINGAWI